MGFGWRRLMECKNCTYNASGRYSCALACALEEIYEFWGILDNFHEYHLHVVRDSTYIEASVWRKDILIGKFDTLTNTQVNYFAPDNFVKPSAILSTILCDSLDRYPHEFLEDHEVFCVYIGIQQHDKNECIW
jgi:hypothetical protein